MLKRRYLRQKCYKIYKIHKNSVQLESREESFGLALFSISSTISYNALDSNCKLLQHSPGGSSSSHSSQSQVKSQSIARHRKASRAEGFCFAIFLEDVRPCSSFQPQLSIALLLAGNLRPSLRPGQSVAQGNKEFPGTPRTLQATLSETEPT